MRIVYAVMLAVWAMSCPERSIANDAAQLDISAAIAVDRQAKIREAIRNDLSACTLLDASHPGSAARQELGSAIADIRKSPLGAWLIATAAERGNLLCSDAHTNLFGYYQPSLALIGMSTDLTDRGIVVFLIHELVHTIEHPDFSDDLRYGARGIVILHRAREAAAEAVATRVLWELRMQGIEAPWEYKLDSPYADIARAFARTMYSVGLGAERQATLAAFFQWYADRARVRDYDLRKISSLEMALDNDAASYGNIPVAEYGSHTLTNEKLCGIGKMGKTAFIAEGADLQLASEPLIVGDLDAVLAQRLEKVDERFRARR